jgi:hypothetical protein
MKIILAKDLAAFAPRGIITSWNSAVTLLETSL